MSIATWIMLGLTVAGWVYVLGTLTQRLKHVEEKSDKVETAVEQLEHWGRAEITNQVDYRDKHFVSIDRFNECIVDIKRRLDTLDSMEISAQLAEIKAMLVGLKEQLRVK
jgi:hypothetical protein